MRSTGWALLACLICASAPGRRHAAGRQSDALEQQRRHDPTRPVARQVQGRRRPDVAVNVGGSRTTSTRRSSSRTTACTAPDDTTVLNTIAAIEALGLNVALKPMVDLSNDSSHWRGQITGGSTWFNGANGYDAFIKHFATHRRRNERRPVRHRHGTERDHQPDQRLAQRDQQREAGLHGQVDLCGQLPAPPRSTTT